MIACRNHGDKHRAQLSRRHENSENVIWYGRTCITIVIVGKGMDPKRLSWDMHKGKRWPG